MKLLHVDSSILGAGSVSRQLSAEIVAAVRTGVRPDGRELAPVMPWHSYGALTDADAKALAAFIKSLPAFSHKVPGPFGPGQTVSSFLFRILPPGETAAAAPK